MAVAGYSYAPSKITAEPDGVLVLDEVHEEDDLLMVAKGLCRRDGIGPICISGTLDGSTMETLDASECGASVFSLGPDPLCTPYEVTGHVWTATHGGAGTFKRQSAVQPAECTDEASGSEEEGPTIPGQAASIAPRRANQGRTRVCRAPPPMKTDPRAEEECEIRRMLSSLYHT